MSKFCSLVNNHDFVEPSLTKEKEILIHSYTTHGEWTGIFLDSKEAKAFAEEILSLIEDSTND